MRTRPAAAATMQTTITTPIAITVFRETLFFSGPNFPAFGFVLTHLLKKGELDD